MPLVLTEGCTVQCSHQGPIVLTASRSALRVGRDRVLVADDLTGAVLSCPQPPATRCNAIVTTTDGISARLLAGGAPVLLATAKGTTNAGTWDVLSAGQTILEAT